MAAFNTATVVAAHQLEFMQRDFPPKSANDGKKKTQGAAAASIKACRRQSEVKYIMYIVMHWQVGIRLSNMNPGTERDRLQEILKGTWQWNQNNWQILPQADLGTPQRTSCCSEET